MEQKKGSIINTTTPVRIIVIITMIIRIISRYHVTSIVDTVNNNNITVNKNFIQVDIATNVAKIIRKLPIIITINFSDLVINKIAKIALIKTCIVRVIII